MHRRLKITVLTALLLHSEIMISTAEPAIYRLVHILQRIRMYLAGEPVVHKKTEWDFDPEVGKLRRIRYEQENGRFGEYAIAKLGMGIGYKGPWGTPVEN
ncbi:uncharacterized protein [Linepithema humile]|uniref:uncharacterized protein isoform X2 n=1 Tax=Linepithema humile TaxID=83485 RepID=UPI0006230CD0|nr:PREDICTED: uncharacterized protein LOC105678905 isoform X2 [Linepithema humile]